MNNKPLTIIIPLAAATVFLGAWRGWEKGREHVPTIAPAGRMASIGIPDSGRTENATAEVVEKWHHIVRGIPAGITLNYSLAWVARLREAARSLPFASLKELVRDGLEKRGPGNTDLLSSDLSILVAEWAARDPGGAVNELAGEDGWHFGGNVFEHWGKKDPASALAWCKMHPASRDDFDDLLRGWASHDPAAAFQAALDNPRESQFQPFDSWAKKDPSAAVAAWAAHQDRPFVRNVRWGLGLDQGNPAQQEELVAAFKSLSDPQLRVAGLGEAASYFAFGGQPEKAVALTEDTALSVKERDGMRWSVLESWRQRDGAAAADWFWKTTPPDRKLAGMEDLLRNWNGPAGAPESCMEWVKNQPPGSLPAETPQLLAQSQFPRSPSAALQNWLALLPGRTDQEQAAPALGRYLATTPQGARLPALLMEAGFPAEVASQVLNAAGHSEG